MQTSNLGEPMPSDAELKLSVMDPDALSFQVWLSNTLPTLHVCHVGGLERFGYAFGRLEGSTAALLWLYQIYRTCVVLCISKPGQGGTANGRPPVLF